MADMTLHRVAVSERHRGMRLDKLLGDVIPGLSRSQAKRLIKSGRVMCRAGERPGAPIVDPDHRVKSGETYRIHVPRPTAAPPLPQAIPLRIAYEDDDLVVVDKPAGLVVHPAPGNPDRTLVNALLAHCGSSLSGIGGVLRPGIVHRLDKDTSGLMVVAKNDVAHHGLSRQFARHTTERSYSAVVWGTPSPARGRIEGNIGRSPTQRKKMAVLRHGGKSALTHYVVKRRFGAVASLVDCRLATGRTHQVRVHLASRGHPLIGDSVYGGRRSRAGERDHPVVQHMLRFPRQALHAYVIGFEHPRTGARLRFESELPADMRALLRELQSFRG